MRLIEKLKLQCANLRKNVDKDGEAQAAILDILQSTPGNTSRLNESIEDISPQRKNHSAKDDEDSNQEDDEEYEK